MIKPNEISDILKQQLEEVESKVSFEEVGTVLEVGDGVAHVFGLDNVSSSELVEFENGVRGVAMNLEESNVGVILMGADSNTVKENMTVRRTGKIASIPVGDGLIGRVINTLGDPIDGAGPVAGETITLPLDRKAPGVIFRQPVNEPLQTGIKAVQRIAHTVLLPAYRLELPVLDLVRALADGQLAAALQFLFLVARLVVGRNEAVMRVPEGKRHAVYLLHLVRLRVAVLLVGEHGIGLVRVEIQRYAVLFVLRVHLIDLLGLARRALRRGGHVIAVRKREVADRLGQRERRAGILHVLLRLLHAQALVRPRMARDAAECTGGERAGHGDGGDGRKRDQTAAPTCWCSRPSSPSSCCSRSSARSPHGS